MTTPPRNGRHRRQAEVPLNVGIPAELKERLTEHCAATNLSQAWVTRQALTEYLDRQTQPKDRP